MKKSIFFDPLFVPMILDGRKTETRRLIKPYKYPWKAGDILGIVPASPRLVYIRKNLPWLWAMIWRAFVVGWVEVRSIYGEMLGSISFVSLDREGAYTREDFKGMWDYIHNPGAWERDQYKWVWAIRFKLLKTGA